MASCISCDVNTRMTFSAVAEFAQTVSSAQEQFALQICTVCEAFRCKTEELATERPISCQDSLLAAWECIVQETLVDGQSQAESASLLVKNIASPLLEIASYKKSQTKKLLSFREAFEYHLDEAKDRIVQKQKVYMDTFQTYNNKQSSKPSHAAYLNAHNDYVLQIRSSNSLLREYTTTALPLLLEELEEIHIDLSNTLSAALESYAISRHSQAGEQSHRYSGAAKVCKRVDPTLDVHDFLDAMQQQEPFSKPFAYNQQSFSINDTLNGTIIMDPMTETAINAKRLELQQQALELSSFLTQNKDIVHALIVMCQRNLARHNRAKVYEIQEDLCRKRNEIRMAQVKLQMTRTQIELLTPKQNGAAQEDGASCSGTGRDSPSLSKAPAKGSIRGLWKKAFKSMKPEKSEKNTNTVSAAAEGGEDSSDNRPEKPKRQSSLKKGLRRKDSKEKEAAAGAVGGGDRFDSEDRPDSSDNPQEIDPVYSLLKCAADLPRQGGKGGSTGHDCCPRGIGIGTNGSSSRGSSPASDLKEDPSPEFMDQHSGGGGSLDSREIRVNTAPEISAVTSQDSSSVIDPSRLRPPNTRSSRPKDHKRAAFVQQRSYSCGDLSPTDPPVNSGQQKERPPMEVKEVQKHTTPRDKERLKPPELCRPPPSSKDRRSGWMKEKQKSKSFDFSWRSGMWSPIDDITDKKSTFTFMAESKPMAPKSKLKPPSMFEIESGSSYESTDHVMLVDPPKSISMATKKDIPKLRSDEKESFVLKRLPDTKARFTEKRRANPPVICQTSVQVEHCIVQESSGRVDRQQWILHERKSHSLDSSFEEHREHSKDSIESIPCQDTVGAVPNSKADVEATMSYIGMTVRDRRLKLLQQRRSRSLDTYDPKAERRCMETAYWSKPAPLERKKSVSKTSSGTRSGSGSGELSGSGRRVSRSPKNLSSSSSPRELSPREPSSKEHSPHSREHSPKVLTLAVNERRKAFAGQKSFSCEVQSQQVPVPVHRKQSEPVVSSLKSKSKGRILPRLPIKEAQLEEHISKVMGSSPSLEPASFPPKESSTKELISKATCTTPKVIIDIAPDCGPVKKQAHFEESKEHPLTGEKRKDFAEQKSFSYEVNQYFNVVEKNEDPTKTESAPSAIDKLRDYIEENEMQDFHSEHMTEVSKYQSWDVQKLPYRPTAAEKKAQVCEMTTQTEVSFSDERLFVAQNKRKHFSEQKSFSYEVPRYRSPERRSSHQTARPHSSEKPRSSEPSISLSKDSVKEPERAEHNVHNRRKSSSAARKIDELSSKAKEERRRRSLQQMVGGRTKEPSLDPHMNTREQRVDREEFKEEPKPSDGRRRSVMAEERRRRDEHKYPASKPSEPRNLASREREGKRLSVHEAQEDCEKSPKSPGSRRSSAEKRLSTDQGRLLDPSMDRRECNTSGKGHERREASTSPYAERRAGEHHREPQSGSGHSRRRSSSGERMKQHAESKSKGAPRDRRRTFAQQKSISCDVGIQRGTTRNENYPQIMDLEEKTPPKSRPPIKTLKEKRMLMMESKKSHSMDEITFIHHIAESNSNLTMSDVLKHILMYSKELEKRQKAETERRKSPDSRNPEEIKKKSMKLQSLKQQSRVEEEEQQERRQHRPSRLPPPVENSEGKEPQRRTRPPADHAEIDEVRQLHPQEAPRKTSPGRSPRSKSKYHEHLSPQRIDSQALELPQSSRKHSPTRSPKSPKERGDRGRPSIRELETRCPRTPIPGALDGSIDERLGIRDKGNISPRAAYSPYEALQYETQYVNRDKPSGDLSVKMPQPSGGRMSPRGGSGDSEKRFSPHSLSSEGGGELSLGVRSHRGSRHRSRESHDSTTSSLSKDQGSQESRKSPRSLKYEDAIDVDGKKETRPAHKRSTCEQRVQ